MTPSSSFRSNAADASRVSLGKAAPADATPANTAADPLQVLPCWCGKGQWSVVFQTHRSGLVKCSACGTFETSPPPLRSEEESAGFYTEYYTDKEIGSKPVNAGETRNAWFWQVAEQVPSLANVRKEALDIGSGDGHFCAELRGAGWPSVTGIEISQTRTARARKFYPEIPFFSCGISETGLSDASLDLIVMDSVIEHLPNPVDMVRDLYRFLAPGGTLVLITPNMASGHFRFLGRHWTGMLAPHAHIFLFSGAGLSQLVSRCGLDVTACGSVHMPAYKPGEYLQRLTSGDLKGTIWRAHQEAGGLYGRITGEGPLLYVVAKRPQ